MPSAFLRGVKMGLGFMVGATALFCFMIFGIAMCAGHFQDQMLEELKEQLEELRPPEEPKTDSV